MKNLIIKFRQDLKLKNLLKKKIIELLKALKKKNIKHKELIAELFNSTKKLKQINKTNNQIISISQKKVHNIIYLINNTQMRARL